MPVIVENPTCCGIFIAPWCCCHTSFSSAIVPVNVSGGPCEQCEAANNVFRAELNLSPSISCLLTGEDWSECLSVYCPEQETPSGYLGQVAVSLLVPECTETHVRLISDVSVTLNIIDGWVGEHETPCEAWNADDVNQMILVSYAQYRRDITIPVDNPSFGAACEVNINGVHDLVLTNGLECDWPESVNVTYIPTYSPSNEP